MKKFKTRSNTLRKYVKMTKVSHPLKLALRHKMRNDVLNKISAESKRQQSEAVTRKVIASRAFKNANKLSIFLSTPNEVNTIPLLQEIFNQNKHVYIPIFTKSKKEFVRLYDMCDYEHLPTSSQSIKQPTIIDNRENVFESGGIDLFLMPGLAFTPSGGRLGYGFGFYDMFFERYFKIYPKKCPKDETLCKENHVFLMGLAFREQILPEDLLPLEEHDIKLDYIVTEDHIYKSK